MTAVAERRPLAAPSTAQRIRNWILNPWGEPRGLVVAAHLSEQNNRPELAREALAAALACTHDDVHVADGAAGSGWLTA